MSFTITPKELKAAGSTRDLLVRFFFFFFLDVREPWETSWPGWITPC